MFKWVLLFFTKPPLSAKAKRHTPQTSNTTATILEYFVIVKLIMSTKLRNHYEK